MPLEDFKPKFAYTPRQLREDNPRRPVDWRYLRAKALADQLAAGQKVAWEACDYRVRRLTELLVAVRQREPDAAIHANFPDIYEAYDIHRRAGRARWQLEALIVTGEDFEILGAMQGVPARAVSTYAELFFDIQSRLCHQGLVAELLLDGVNAGNVSQNDLDKFWKLLGLNMAAEHLVIFIRSGVATVEASEVVVNLADSQLPRNALQVALTSPVNSMTGEVMMSAEMNRRTLALRKRELQEKLASGGGDGKPVDKDAVAKRLLEGMKMTVSDLENIGLPAVEGPPSPELVAQLSSAVRTVDTEKAKKPQESEA